MLLAQFYRKFIYAILIFSVSILSVTQVGCASGGFKLTRQYARFVNKQQIIIRIVLYILTAVVFLATLQMSVRPLELLLKVVFVDLPASLASDGQGMRGQRLVVA